MEEKEVVLDNKKIKTAIKLPKEEYEENNMFKFTEDTIELDKVIKDIKDNDKK